MYTVVKMLNGEYECQGRVQDGTEYWVKKTREEAVQSMIKFARVANGTYITEKDISFLEQKPAPTVYNYKCDKVLSKEDTKLLEDIKRGALKVLKFNHYLLRYNLSEEDCKKIIDVREGRARIIYE